MPAALSVESKIDGALRGFRCSQASFVALFKDLYREGLSAGLLNEAINGRRSLDQNIAEKIFSLLSQMDSLQKAVNDVFTTPVSVDWGRTQEISTALTLRMLAQVDQGQQFVELADQATKAVSHVS